jgi:hypothetical protein
MNVLIDGVSFVRWDTLPDSPLQWRMTADHVASAEALPNGWAALKWAIEAEATVSEMEAWSRADSGLTSPKPKVQPLPVKKRALF